MEKHFEKIKTYLMRMRNATYEILIEEDNIIQFEIRNKYYEKLFTIHYSDMTTNTSIGGQHNPRPMWHHYFLQFEQELVPDIRHQCFCTVTEWKWYLGEDDVLYRIKTLKNRYKY